ncbi:MAG: hypothetical protein GX937_14110 [Lentisphaerae bacterium]|nr:hypothetical protein [Lentisphaerota bacterium]
MRNCSTDDVPFLQRLYSKVSYGGNPQHKKRLGEFRLSQPPDPRPMKSLCDEVSVYKPSEALDLLKLGIAKGFISVLINEYGFPKNIWSVITLKNGKEVPLEAQIENPYTGSYHGYPLQPTDPMYEKILEKWRTSECLISK